MPAPRENHRVYGPYEIDPKYLEENTEPYDTFMIVAYGAIATLTITFWVWVAIQFFD